MAAPKLKILDSVRAYVTPFTLKDFGKEGVYWLAMGARQVIHNLCSLTDAAIEALVAKVVGMCPVKSPMWTKMSEAPFRPFFALMRKAFVRGVAEGSSDNKTDVSHDVEKNDV